MHRDFRGFARALWRPVWIRLAALAGAFSLLSEIFYQILPDDLAQKLPRFYNIVVWVGQQVPWWVWFVGLLLLLIGAMLDLLWRIWNRQQELEGSKKLRIEDSAALVAKTNSVEQSVAVLHKALLARQRLLEIRPLLESSLDPLRNPDSMGRHKDFTRIALQFPWLGECGVFMDQIRANALIANNILPASITNGPDEDKRRFQIEMRAFRGAIEDLERRLSINSVLPPLP